MIYTRLLVIIVAILSAYIFYVFIVKPFFLVKTCLIDTDMCLRLEYFRYKDTVLLHAQPTGYWVWFDGKNIMIYGEPTGRVCDTTSEPVYMYDTKANKISGYACVKTLTEVQKFYKNIKPEFIYVHDPDINYNVYDLINMLVKRKIISLPT